MAREALFCLLSTLLMLAALAPVGASAWPAQAQCETFDTGVLDVQACVGGTVCYVVGNGPTYVRACVDPAGCPNAQGVAPPPAVCDPGDADDDHDGYSPNQGDCNDSDSSVHPGAFEHPDGIDNDCNGAVDDGDMDGDGWTTTNGDCDDMDPSVNPGQTEQPGNGIDDDCDGLVD